MFMHEAQHEAMPVASSSETHGGLVASDAIHWSDAADLISKGLDWTYNSH